ncbi:MAG: response regulator transcription factor [Anaerolineae bacterium]|nr:response regulator transcription factor [Anaerolineae bacterium]
MRVFIADDHAVLRAGLRLLIDSQSDMQAVGEASNGGETLARVKSVNPDILLLDLSMPGLGGLAILRDLRIYVPQMRVVVLTMHTDEAYVREALRLGASGYVVKSAADQELLAALRAVARGEIYIHPSLTRSLLDNLLPVQPNLSGDPWDDLSEREQQVIRRVAQGYTNREIAEQLQLSVKTIDTYRARAMEKLALHTRAQLIEYAHRRGLLND